MADKKIYLIRTGIILFYLSGLIFLIYVLTKNPIESDIYGFIVHDNNLFHCPSCGLTRAVYCLVRFDFKGAFYYHAFFTVLSPILAYIVITLTVNLFAGKKIIPYPKHSAIYLWVIFGLFIAFGILRNFTDIIY